MSSSESFISSESIQRQHSIDVFSRLEEEEAAQEQALTPESKAHKVIDSYIEKHSSTKAVRKEAKDNNRDGSYQLDLSADIVTILEKIKGELG